MELHRLIFRLDFAPAFGIFSRWGEILSYLHSSGLWASLGEQQAPRGIVASSKDGATGKAQVVTVRVRDIDGTFEQHPFQSQHSFDDVLDRVSYVLTLLEVERFERVGVRFLFLEPCDSFEAACSLVASQVKGEYWNLFEDRVSDMSIVSVHAGEDHSLRLATGPMRRAEYPTSFNAPGELKLENAILFDVDCSAQSYRAEKFDLKKLVALYYDKALSQSERVYDLIKGKD